MVDVAFEGRYKPIFLIDNSPIHKWVLYSAFYFPFFLNLNFLRTMPPDALNARSMNCKGKAIGLFIYKHVYVHHLSLGFQKEKFYISS